MAEYIIDNPQIIVNGFIHSGIPGAVDGLQQGTDSGSESSQEDYTSYKSDTSEEESEDTIIVL